MIPKDRMVEMAYGPHPPVKSDLRGLYTDADTTIYLLEDWNRHALLERSTLLHELVHHLLSVNKVKLQCAAASERPAYYLQLEWLRDQGGRRRPL